MKKNAPVLAMLLLMFVFAIGCSTPSPTDLIVGKWQLDSLSIKPGAVLMDSDSFDFYENVEGLMASNLVFDFLENRNLITSQIGYEERGSYQILTDPTQLSFEFNGQNRSTDLVTLTEEQLVFSINDPQMDYIVFHLRRVK